MQTRRHSLPVALIACAIGASPAQSQPDTLVPPPGPVVPTDAVRFNAGQVTLPLVIDAPGAYILTSDFVGVAGEDGIIIAASDVTIDLNGFALRGVPGSLNGIRLQSGTDDPARICIRNGVVTGWGEVGVDLWPGRASRVEQVQASGNGAGISVPEDSLVRSCQATGNSGAGILTYDGSIVRDCISSENGSYGFFLRARNQVSECTARANGLSGFSAWNDTLLDACIATDNLQHGFLTVNQVAIRNCIAGRNQQSGIWTSWGTEITNTRVERNQFRGIDAGEDNTISDCTVSLNEASGILAKRGSTIVGCRVAANSRSDPLAWAVSTAENCTLEHNEFRLNMLGESGGPGLLVKTESGGAFRFNTIYEGDSDLGSTIVTNNSLLLGATFSASGPGVAATANSIASAGPYDNIQFPN